MQAQSPGISVPYVAELSRILQTLSFVSALNVMVIMNIVRIIFSHISIFTSKRQGKGIEV